MTADGRRRIADLKVISLVVGITLALAGVSWSIVGWATSRVSRDEAAEAHAKMETKEEAQQLRASIHARMTAVEDRQEKNQAKLEEKVDKLTDTVWKIYREVRQ